MQDLAPGNFPRLKLSAEEWQVWANTWENGVLLLVSPWGFLSGIRKRDDFFPPSRLPTGPALLRKS